MKHALCSEKLSELDGVHVRDAGLGDVDNACFTGLFGNTLGVQFDTLGLSLSLEFVISADTFDEGLTGG